jgi:hypothetical protein
MKSAPADAGLKLGRERCRSGMKQDVGVSASTLYRYIPAARTANLSPTGFENMSRASR